MKKTILLFLGTIAFFNFIIAQPLIQASLGTGSAANRVKIYIKSAATQAPANLSTLQFNIGISTSITPKPTLSVVSTTLSGVNWFISQATEGGYYNYQFTTATSPLQPNLTANTEFEVMEVGISGGPLSLSSIALVTLPDGGVGASTGNSLFLCTGSLGSVGNNLYYTRTGVTVNNQFSYDATGATSGTTTSTATISNISLPLTWVAFTSKNQNSDAILNWKVANNNNNSYFDVEVSNDGIKFSSIASLASTSDLSYTYTDTKFSSRGNNIIYYRIKQTDIDGKYSYSAVTTVKAGGKNIISIFPNPTNDVVYISGDATYLTITDITGKVYLTNQLKNNLANKIDVSVLQKGIYLAILQNSDGSQTSKKLVIN